MKLNPRHRVFVQEYLKDRNATQAAIRAGYAAKNADVTGPRLLGVVGIAQAIEKGSAEIAAQARVDAVWLLKRLVSLADVKISDLFTEDGKLRDPQDMPDGAQHLIAGIEVEELFEFDEEIGKKVRAGTLRKVKLESRMKALEMIGKHVDVGAFLERLALTDESSLAADLIAARKRARESRKKR